MARRRRDPWGGTTHFGDVRRSARMQVEALGDALGYVSRHTLGTGFVWLSLAVALAIPGALLLLGDSLTSLTRGQATELQAGVFLVPGLDEDRSAAVMRRITDMPEVTRWTITAPDTALQEMETVLGTDLTAALGGENPLPIRLDVTLRANIGDAAQRQFVDHVKTLPEVDAVAAEWRWRARVRDTLALFRQFAWALGGLLAASAVLVAHASVRMAVESRIAEIQVFVLLGADRGTVRRPFTWLGVLYGAGGGLLAAMLISALLLVLEPTVQRLLQTYGGEPLVINFGLGFAAMLILTGTLLGLLGATLAAREGAIRAEQVSVW